MGPAGRALTFGTRDEHLAPSDRGLTIVIDLIEWLGSEIAVHGRLAAAAGKALTVQLAGPVPTGERLTVWPSLAHPRAFDRDTGLRIEPAAAPTLAQADAAR